MLIEHFKVENFRNFEEKELLLHPEFNLIVGVNGAGKTALLDAISISIATWLIGFKSKLDSRNISKSDARLESQQGALKIGYENQYPVTISAYGRISENRTVSWVRSKHSEGGNTRYGESRELLELAREADRRVRSNKPTVLPLVAYYGTMRLWNEPNAIRSQSKIKNPDTISEKRNMSRLQGYRFSVDPRISTKNLIKWFARQSWIDFQKSSRENKTSSLASDLVKRAILSCMDGISDLSFDAERGELMLTLEVNSTSNTQPFANLSDGQRSTLALVADIAQKAISLNPDMGQSVLKDTPGIVLIDELDLHLHPQWQRNLIENLRQTFPNIQFICTTHSPFLIQSLRSGEELIMLDGHPTAQLVNKPIEEISRGIMGIENPQVAARYEKMKDAARHYLEMLEEAAESPEEKLESYKQQLADSIAPYADNPAYQAFLEMNRIAKIGA